MIAGQYATQDEYIDENSELKTTNGHGDDMSRALKCLYVCKLNHFNLPTNSMDSFVFTHSHSHLTLSHIDFLWFGFIFHAFYLMQWGERCFFSIHMRLVFVYPLNDEQIRKFDVYFERSIKLNVSTHSRHTKNYTVCRVWLYCTVILLQCIRKTFPVCVCVRHRKITNLIRFWSRFGGFWLCEWN